MPQLSHPRRGPIQSVLLALIGGYRRAISPLLPRACRFHPSCSEYAADAIATHGAGRGIALATTRLLRCHPWCEGGFDAVPPRRTHEPEPGARAAGEHA